MGVDDRLSVGNEPERLGTAGRISFSYFRIDIVLTGQAAILTFLSGR